MRVTLFQIDGVLPSVALMRIAAHHRAQGDEVELRRGANVETTLWDAPDKVYASGIFRSAIPAMERLKQIYPDAILGGTAIDPPRAGELIPLSPIISKTYTKLPFAETLRDYGLYPGERRSMGFTMRGCSLNCSFCRMQDREGPAHSVATIPQLWRGGDHPRELLLFDNDFFGQPENDWRARVREIVDGRFKVSFSQGINARFLTDEAAEALAAMDCRDDGMKNKRIYTAWDNLKDEERLFAGLQRLVKYGVKPDHIMVFVLVGYWPGETAADREYRRVRLREFGARPYPMPFVRTRELVGFQRWIVGAYDKRPEITWARWEANNYRPEGIVGGKGSGPDVSPVSQAGGGAGAHVFNHIDA